MSLSWTFLTKSFLPLRYRDTVAGLIIAKFAISKYIGWRADSYDNHYFSRIYTHDESSIEFKDPSNMHDSAVRA